MQNVFREAANLLGKNEPLVVATVIRTKGSTPQKTGAKLLVRADGTGVGTLGGGCVEGDIWFAASELLKRGGSSQYREYMLNEELAAQDGLVCGGTMYFLIDPIYTPDDYLMFAKEIDDAYEGKGAVALATITQTLGDIDIGAKLFIRADGSVVGTLGMPKLDEHAIKKAMELMALGKNQIVKTEYGVEYFIEAYTTPPQLVLCGGGHVSKAIGPLAKNLGFQVFVTDDRKGFANQKRFPEASLIVAKKPEEALFELPINENSFVVIATRGHRYDNVALEAAAMTKAQYVGLLGSKRKTIMIYEDMIRNATVPIERIRAIRSPIGLNIFARTPEEIAVSIMGEILMFRLGGDGTPMKLEKHQFDRIIEKIRKEHSVSIVN